MFGRLCPLFFSLPENKKPLVTNYSLLKITGHTGSEPTLTFATDDESVLASAQTLPSALAPTCHVPLVLASSPAPPLLESSYQ